jgi:hypothetical protein
MITVEIELAALPEGRLATMRAAAEEWLRCQDAFERAGRNVVGEVLRGHGEFYEMNHYPPDDVFDENSHAQWYFHAHRGGTEHGHFHLFLRAAGMPAGCAPVAHEGVSEPWPAGAEALSHLVAVSMDAWGRPQGLFCTNRWVTDEAWYPASEVIAMIDRFEVDHAFPNWAVNRWLTALVRLYQPHIAALVRQRDEVVADWRRARPTVDIFEDRGLEITGYLPIDPAALIDALRPSRSIRPVASRQVAHVGD